MANKVLRKPFPTEKNTVRTGELRERKEEENASHMSEHEVREGGWGNGRK